MCVAPPRVPAPPPGSRCGRGDIGAAGGGGGDGQANVCPAFFLGGGGVMLRGDPPTPLCLPPPLGQVPWPGGVPSRPVPPPRVSPRFVFSLIIPIPRLRGGVDPGGEETPLPPIQPQNVTPSSCARSFGVTGWGLGVKGGLFPPQNPAVSLARAPGTPGGTKTPVLNPWGRLIPPRPPAPTRSSAPQNKDAARAPTPPFCSALGKRG